MALLEAFIAIFIHGWYQLRTCSKSVFNIGSVRLGFVHKGDQYSHTEKPTEWDESKTALQGEDATEHT